MDEKIKRNLQRARRAIEAADMVAKTNIGRNRVEEVQLHTAGVVEPGYDNRELVATGNWNNVSARKADTGKFEDIDTVMSRLGDVLTKLGFELEWSDEWATCDDCQKLFRTQADSYSWKPSYVFDEESGDRVCVECVDPVDHLQKLEGNERSANTIDTIDPAEHGYVLVEEGFEHGFHPGQDADPKVIAKALRAQDIERFVFNLDSNSQFDSRFSVYVHQDEADKLNREAFDEAEKDGSSVSEGLKRGLQAASAAMAKLPDGQGIKYASLNADGTADVRLVSPEEFIEGVKR